MLRGLSIATMLLCAMPVAAQEKTVTLTMTVTEAQTALNEIGKAPWKDVNPLLQKLIAQLNAQLAPTPPPAPSAQNQEQ